MESRGIGTLEKGLTPIREYNSNASEVVTYARATIKGNSSIDKLVSS
jgi:hypothetical protein